MPLFYKNLSVCLSYVPEFLNCLPMTTNYMYIGTPVDMMTMKYMQFSIPKSRIFRNQIRPYIFSVYYVVDSDEQAERAAFSYGYGATLPASSQRRMKQSVHLASRCLQLERQMVGDKRKMCELESTIENLRQEVK